MTRTIAEASGLWTPQGSYLNTASYGFPPAPAWDALQSALDDWCHGRASWEDWSQAVGRSRRAFAELVHVPEDWVVAGANVSSLAGLIAASLPVGSCVLVPETEFTSNLYPWIAQAHRGVRVITVPLGELLHSITPATTVVAVSSVQSNDGTVTSLDEVADAAAEVGAFVFVDASQACGWLPTSADRVDFLACGAYKWLMAPRGSAFMTIRPEHLEWVVPAAAGWFAAEDPHGSYYGPEFRLAKDARRLDVSPAWFSWVGTAPALETVLEIGVDNIHQHDVGLANRFRAGLGLGPGSSAIVAAEVDGADEKLRAAGVLASTRAGKMRAAFHLYNTESDVDRALDALTSSA